ACDPSPRAPRHLRPAAALPGKRRDRHGLGRWRVRAGRAWPALAPAARQLPCLRDRGGDWLSAAQPLELSRSWGRAGRWHAGAVRHRVAHQPGPEQLLGVAADRAVPPVARLADRPDAVRDAARHLHSESPMGIPL
ncbi:MAG: hypothetical protein AVDCRST_MAG09-649, partial [uncultured Sphingomonas sp.]